MDDSNLAVDADRVQRVLDQFLDEHPPHSTPEVSFLGARFDAGLAWVWFPPGCGGLGVTPSLQRHVDDRLDAAGAPWDPDRNILGLGMAAPTILTHGSETQIDRYLRPLFTNEEIWCQLFSEPGAGSDLAAVSTSAVRDGDEWIVTGQKVWTTLAHEARWGLLLARTDRGASRHAGLTYFILDMRAPGVEVRPLRQLTGDAEFNEVFLDQVRVSDRQRVGAVGDGWKVAMTTLMNERVAIGAKPPSRGGGAIGAALRVWRSAEHDPVKRDRLVSLWIAAEVNRLTNLRASARRAVGTPGPEGSVAKLGFAEVNQRIFDFCVDLLGMNGALYPPGYEMRRPQRATFDVGDVRYLFLRARGNSIEGGTSEVMRNILAERVLGLPKEPRSDRPR